jgi:RsiW-degrading membrane proteinase PrsW (M82 family)
VFLSVIALAPAIGLVWLMFAMRAYQPESRLLVAVLFILGAGSALLALVLNHAVEKYTQLWTGAPQQSLRLLFWVFGIGLNEEFSKMVILLLVLYPRRGFTTSFQGILGAATVALGFAAVENLFYLERFGTPTLLIRSILTVPAHACFTIPNGVCLFLSKRAEGVAGKYFWLVAGLTAAMTFHGVYNIWLSLDDVWLNRLAYVQVALMAVLAFRLIRWNLAPVGVPAEER